MDIFEIRTNGDHRNIEFEGGIEALVEALRAEGNVVARIHGSDRWLVLNPATLGTLEVGNPVVRPPD